MITVETIKQMIEGIRETMMKGLCMLLLKDITRYDDVEEGHLELTVDNHQKSYKAVWLTNLRLQINGNNHLPRGNIPIKYKTRQLWIDCPRLRLNSRKFMWIEPLNASTWENMGVNIYLCSDEGWPHPLPRRDFEQLVNVLMEYGIDTLRIEEPQQIIVNNKYRSNDQLSLDDFWDS